VVTTQTLERTYGLNTLNTALQAIKAIKEEAREMFNIQLQVNCLKYYLNISITCIVKKRKTKYIMSFICIVIEIIKEIIGTKSHLSDLTLAKIKLLVIIRAYHVPVWFIVIMKVI
jgi:hypothetical protein